MNMLIFDNRTESYTIMKNRMASMSKQKVNLLVCMVMLWAAGSSANAGNTADGALLVAGLTEQVKGWFGSDDSAKSTAKRKALYKEWVLPDVAPSPKNNRMEAKKAELGKMLFFDPRLSGDGKMSCATCHNPQYGWSDGFPTARGDKNKVLARATPTVINVGFNKILMWDGREATLEDQAMGPILNPEEMNNTVKKMLRTLKGIPEYVRVFKEAFSGLPPTEGAYRRAMAMYQRTIVANDSRFDHWVSGKADEMSAEEKEGFQVFTDPERGNCAVCHRPPNFTDDGFHNIGLASFGKKDPDLGRFNEKPVRITKGAFKTPPLRNITQTAPYFHDGSAQTLRDVVEHYASGGAVRTNLSPNLKRLNLSTQEKAALVKFLQSLTSELDPDLFKVRLPR